MVKIRHITIYLLFLYGSINYTCASSDLTPIYLSEIGVREATGKNDGKRVEQYLHSTGNHKGEPWCASFVRWCFDQAGIKTKITGAAASAENPRNLIFAKGRFLKPAQPGDVFCIYSYSKGRINHTGFFHRLLNNSLFESVEGNTNNTGSAEGDGVYRRIRSLKATYSISRWP